MGLLSFIVKETAIKSAEKVAIKTAEIVGSYIEKKEKANPKENPGITYFRLPSSYDEYLGKDVETVAGDFYAYGFKNIVKKPRKDLIKGWLNKDGDVISVEVNGKREFKKNTRVPSESRIVIEYHTFKDK